MVAVTDILLMIIDLPSFVRVLGVLGQASDSPAKPGTLYHKTALLWVTETVQNDCR
jgi:hypothetical protein